MEDVSNLVETLYYQTYNSVLLGNSSNAKMYLSFLREEFDKDSKQFECLEEDGRWEHLKELGNVIDNNLVVKNFDEIKKTNEKVVKEDDEAQFRKQRELINAICLAKDDLRMCLEAESDFCCIGSEIETRFGRVDLVAQDKYTMYPIEVKKSGADHGVIGQIDKYIMHYKLGLINKIYKHVIGVVIANGFTDYVLHEIHRFGAVAIRYKFKGSQNIELTRV